MESIRKELWRIRIKIHRCLTTCLQVFEIACNYKFNSIEIKKTDLIYALNRNNGKTIALSKSRGTSDIEHVIETANYLNRNNLIKEDTRTINKSNNHTSQNLTTMNFFYNFSWRVKIDSII